MKIRSLLKFVCAVLLACAGGSAVSGPVVRCPDGVFREAPCPGEGAQRSVSPPASTLTCDPAHPGYAVCQRTMDAHWAERNRQDRAEQQRQQAKVEAEQSGRAWHRLTRNCDFLNTEMERADCRRNTRNTRIHDRDLRNMQEAERQAQLAARSAAARANLEAEERRRAAAAAAASQRWQAQQNSR
jgi:hypothetical protein